MSVWFRDMIRFKEDRAGHRARVSERDSAQFSDKVTTILGLWLQKGLGLGYRQGWGYGQG